MLSKAFRKIRFCFLFYQPFRRQAVVWLASELRPNISELGSSSVSEDAFISFSFLIRDVRRTVQFLLPFAASSFPQGGYLYLRK